MCYDLSCRNQQGGPMMSDWNSAQYLLFENERTAPAQDLARRLSALAPEKILDLGCGPANSTRVLYDQFPQAHLVGADLSPDMLRRARAALPQAQFVQCDVSGDLSALGDGYDIVFSNAVLQWLENHAQVLSNWMTLLRPGGILAVQMPINEPEPAIAAIGALAAQTPQRFESVVYQRSRPLPLEAYYDMLSAMTDRFAVWTTTYCHRMTEHRQILEWVRGARLRPYLDCLSPGQVAEFEQALLEQIQKDYPRRPNGDILFFFRRLFFTAMRR